VSRNTTRTSRKLDRQRHRPRSEGMVQAGSDRGQRILPDESSNECTRWPGAARVRDPSGDEIINDVKERRGPEPPRTARPSAAERFRRWPCADAASRPSRRRPRPSTRLGHKRMAGALPCADGRDQGTRDSFSAGGRFDDTAAALDAASGTRRRRRYMLGNWRRATRPGAPAPLSEADENRPEWSR